MAFINPRTLRFTMPSNRTDGTSLEGTALNANLYIDGVNVLSIPGELNPGGEYTLLFADLGWVPTPGAEHILYLTALADGLESAPSGSLEIQFVSAPQAPFGLEVFA